MSIIEKTIIDFEKNILNLEEHLFGLSLYYDTMPFYIKWMNKISFKRILSRSNDNLEDARQLLRKAKLNNNYLDDLEKFFWISRPKLMDSRIKTLLEIYYKVFGNRPKKRLSKYESNILRSKLVNYL